MSDPYFCPTTGVIRLPQGPAFEECCTHPWVHVVVPDIQAIHRIAGFLSDQRRERHEAQQADAVFRRKLAEYAIELVDGPQRVRARSVHDRLVVMLRMPWEPDTIKTDRELNDPEGLWGPAPGYRCWVGRHDECEPLGADESCTCSCGMGAGGHGMDRENVKTPGCDCGHEEMGETWHARDCAWRSTRVLVLRQAALDAVEEAG